MKYRAGEKESARTAEEDAPVIPAGLWKKCNKCGKPIYTDDVRAVSYTHLMIRKDMLKKGDKIIMSGFGAGMTWGCLLYTSCALLRLS